MGAVRFLDFPLSAMKNKKGHLGVEGASKARARFCLQFFLIFSMVPYFLSCGQCFLINKSLNNHQQRRELAFNN